MGAGSLVAVEALLLLIAAALLWALGDRVRHRRPAPGGPPGRLGALTMGASYVAGSPLMRLVAVAYVLLAVLLFSLTYPFLTAMRAAFPDESELLPVLAVISAAVTVASFLAGTLLANRLFVRFGVATVALALPLVYLAGFGLWLVRFGTATAIAVRVAQQVTQRGVSNAAWGALFNVIPSRLRGQVLAFMDGVPGQLGTMLSGVLLILASSLALEQVFVLGLVTALACLGVGLLIRRAYASSLVATLREGQAEQVLEGGPGLRAMASDPLVVAELREETRSTEARRRLLATDLLTRLGSREALADLQRLLRRRRSAGCGAQPSRAWPGSIRRVPGRGSGPLPATPMPWSARRPSPRSRLNGRQWRPRCAPRRDAADGPRPGCPGRACGRPAEGPVDPEEAEVRGPADALGG